MLEEGFDRPAVLGTVVVEVGVPVVIFPTPALTTGARNRHGRVYRVGGLVFVALIFPVVVVMMIVMMLIMVLIVCVMILVFVVVVVGVVVMPILLVGGVEVVGVVSVSASGVVELFRFLSGCIFLTFAWFRLFRLAKRLAFGIVRVGCGRMLRLGRVLGMFRLLRLAVGGVVRRFGSALSLLGHGLEPSHSGDGLEN